MCEALFERLATKDPARLFALVVSGTLKVPDLTFAAEWLGQCDASLAVPALLLLLSHESAVVREGAIYGLGNHVDVGEVRGMLDRLVSTDASQAVRLAALEAIA